MQAGTAKRICDGNGVSWCYEGVGLSVQNKCWHVTASRVPHAIKIIDVKVSDFAYVLANAVHNRFHDALRDPTGTMLFDKIVTKTSKG
mmetsp:Transcript_65862/g.76547  ORF Transcript_65862/g.76547 Transcript_65862/m.76547 type:complete len:88 (+) Transcript_65862:44-307(+)